VIGNGCVLIISDSVR